MNGLKPVRLLGQTTLKWVRRSYPVAWHSTSTGNDQSSSGSGNWGQVRLVAVGVGVGALVWGGISATLKAEAERKSKPVAVEFTGAR